MEPQQTHTIRTRTAHWLNAAFIAFLVWSGFSMFAGDRHFAPFVRLVPSAFWHAWHFTGSKRELFTWHVYAGTFFGINGAAYVLSLIVTRGWRRVVPRGARRVHDPMRPLDYTISQRLAYTAVLSGGALMVLTGSALWFKHQAPWLLAAMGGERLVLPAHIVLATSLLGFIAIHLLQVLRAGTPTWRSMTVGRGVSKEPVAVRLPVENPL